ncbi:hypothetical protein [Tenacibaculum agarivorans]|uniref:hypothetical protein n=1 Tax=Tenacibaculum agarivorans TaxID=1908389 RepID=UPI00094B9637|nr:hypothetical protein [Tenacibaculum agarivorans]
MKKLTIFFLSVLFLQNLLSQDTKQHELLYSLLDNTINNVNTKLSYGTVYKEKYIKRSKETHNFFKTNVFQKGSITYRNEIFYNVFIKYDIVDDYVVLKISNLNQHISIIPEKEFVENFKIGATSFIKTKPYGFIEKIASNKHYSLFRKHRKVSKDNQDKNFVHHTFKKEKDLYILQKDEQYTIVKSKRDFIKIFPEKKKVISKFFQKHKKQLKNDFKEFSIELMKVIYE